MRHRYEDLQAQAAGAVTRAVSLGFLLPAKMRRCVDCGAPAYGYDHRDYSRPLEVEPVCRSHNKLRGRAGPKWIADAYDAYLSRVRAATKMASALHATIGVNETGLYYEVGRGLWHEARFNLSGCHGDRQDNCLVDAADVWWVSDVFDVRFGDLFQR